MPFQSQLEQVEKAAFFDELEKISYDWRAIKRVSRLAKARTVKTPPGRTSLPVAVVSMPGAMAKKTVTMSRETARKGQISQEAAEASRRLAEQLKGKMVVPKKVGGFVGTLKDTPFDRPMSGKARRALESVGAGHELDELVLGARKMDMPLVSRFGHVSPDVLLRERNRLLTMPRGTKRAAKGVLGKLRKATGEEDLLERATRGVSGKGLGFTKGLRLSRHARRRVSKRMSALNVQDLKAGAPRIYNVE